MVVLSEVAGHGLRRGSAPNYLYCARLQALQSGRQLTVQSSKLGSYSQVAPRQLLLKNQILTLEDILADVESVVEQS